MLELSDWKIVKRDGKIIGYDLEEYPLEILSNSVIGGYGRIRVNFYDTSRAMTGHLSILFGESSTITWKMFCYNADQVSSSEIPITANKIWKITKSGHVTTLHCNEQQVAEINYNDGTQPASCKDMADMDIDYIMVHDEDTASDFIRTKGIRISSQLLLV